MGIAEKYVILGTSSFPDINHNDTDLFAENK